MKAKKRSTADDLAAQMLNSCFNAYSEEAGDVLRAFARYVGGFKVSRETAPLYLKILATNESDVVESLIGNRYPFLLFRHTKPNREILQWAFHILAEHDPVSIHQSVLVAMLGIIDMTYKNLTEGNTLRQISMFELNHIAKYLNEREDQYHEINRVILSILEHFYYHNAELTPEKNTRTLGIHSMRIRLAFLDRKYCLQDVIPEQILGPLVETQTIVDTNKENTTPSMIDRAPLMHSLITQDKRAFYE